MTMGRGTIVLACAWVLWVGTGYRSVPLAYFERLADCDLERQYLEGQGRTRWEVWLRSWIWSAPRSMESLHECLPDTINPETHKPFGH
jgi:hypothetical protein